MKNRKPNIHRFKTPCHCYIYDVNSNEIVKVDELTFKILELYGTIRNEQIIDCLKDDYPQKAIVDCLTEIEYFQQSQGVFLVKYPDKMESLVETLNLQEIYQHYLGQLVLNVTEACNLRCEYCVYSGHYKYNRQHGNRKMSFETAKSAIDYFIPRTDRLDRVNISFYGGEPLLNFDVIKKSMEYANTKRETVFFNLTTNGTLLDKRKIEFLVDNDVAITISLDGPQAIHDRNRKFANGNGTYQKVINALELIKDYSPKYFENRLGINAVYDGRTDLEFLSEFFNERDFILPNRFRVSRVTGSDTSYFDNIKLLKDNGFEKLEKDFLKGVVEGKVLTELQRKLFIEPLINIRERAINPQSKDHTIGGLCVPGAKKILVQVDGKFYICEKCETTDIYCIGNIDTGIDMKRIERLIDVRCSNTKECTTCWAVRLCSLCYLPFIRGGKYDSNKRDENCEKMRRSIDKNLVNFTQILEQNAQALDFMDAYSRSSHKHLQHQLTDDSLQQELIN